jgi:CubicO group peptidase (beta-lactamase class C family)
MLSMSNVRLHRFVALLALFAPSIAEAQLYDSRVKPSVLHPSALLGADVQRAQSSAVYGLQQAPCAVADSEACSAARSAIAAAVAALFESSSSNAVQIAVREHGRFVYSQAFGSEDPQGLVPATRRSLFQIGSNTKKATAIAVLRAVQEGALALDQTVDEILPELELARDPEWTHKATLRQLLSHQSGLWDYTPWTEASADADLAKFTYGTFAEHEWSTTPPGAVWNYSNANFALLGAVLERVYGEPYRKVVERAVYKPLRMRHTYARREEAVESGHAVWSYGVSPKALASSSYDPWSVYSVPDASGTPQSMEWVAPQDQEDNAFLRPAGLTWSTAEDECRVGSFLISGNDRVLHEGLRHEIVTPQAKTAPDANAADYGFGIGLSQHLRLGPDAYDIEFWEHNGATVRMGSEMFVFPEQGLTFSVLTNSSLRTEEASTAWQLLVISILRAYVALPQPHAATAPEPPDDGARYAGTYADPLGLGTVVLQWDGSKLTLTAPELTARGAMVDELLQIAQKNLLIGRIDGQPVGLQVWPSSSSDAAYLVSRADAFTRVAGP